VEAFVKCLYGFSVNDALGPEYRDSLLIHLHDLAYDHDLSKLIQQVVQHLRYELDHDFEAGHIFHSKPKGWIWELIDYLWADDWLATQMLSRYARMRVELVRALRNPPKGAKANQAELEAGISSHPVLAEMVLDGFEDILSEREAILEGRK